MGALGKDRARTCQLVLIGIGPEYTGELVLGKLVLTAAEVALVTRKYRITVPGTAVDNSRLNGDVNVPLGRENSTSGPKFAPRVEFAALKVGVLKYPTMDGSTRSRP